MTHGSDILGQATLLHAPKGNDMLQKKIDKLWTCMMLAYMKPIPVMLKRKIVKTLQKEGVVGPVIDEHLFELRPEGTLVYCGNILARISNHLLPQAEAQTVDG